MEKEDNKENENQDNSNDRLKLKVKLKTPTKFNKITGTEAETTTMDLKQTKQQQEVQHNKQQQDGETETRKQQHSGEQQITKEDNQKRQQDTNKKTDNTKTKTTTKKLAPPTTKTTRAAGTTKNVEWETMKEYLRKKREDRDNKTMGTSFNLQQNARQNSIVKASNTFSTLKMFSGETETSQTKPESDGNTRNLARDS